MEDLTPGLMAAQVFGFAPAEYIRNQERNQILKGIDRTVNEKRSNLLRNLYTAMRVGDDTRDIMDEIKKFNKKWPQHRIDPATIKRSLKQHMDTTMKMHDGVLFSPAMYNEMIRLSREFPY